MKAVVATAHYASTASRVFSILNDPSSWGQERLPRVTSATPPSKVVLTFDGAERATIAISSWNTDICQVELILDGFTDQQALTKLQN
jgi:hypothetical protein